MGGWFAELIRKAHAASGKRVVVLVDEYDKPILDNITDPEMAREMRDGLRDLYSVIKDSDAHIRFAFLTGVTKFSKVSLFSGLNNLKDLTVDVRYSAICGYTEADLDQVFAPELVGLDLTPEESSNAGRLDLTLRFNGHVYLIEFKLVETAPEGRALEQIKAKGYADRHRGTNQPIHLIGVEFSRQERKLVGFEVETLAGG